MVFNDHSASGTSQSVSLDTLVSGNLNPEAARSWPIRSKQAPHRLVLRIDGDRISHFDATRRPGTRCRFVAGDWPLGSHSDHTDTRDAQIIFYTAKSWKRDRHHGYRRGGQEISTVHHYSTLGSGTKTLEPDVAVHCGVRGRHSKSPIKVTTLLKKLWCQPTSQCTILSQALWSICCSCRLIANAQLHSRVVTHHVRTTSKVPAHQT